MPEQTPQAPRPEVPGVEGASSAQSAALSARVLRQVLTTPVFRDILRVHVSEGGQGAGGDLLRTVLREDPELLFGAASATPQLVNTVIESLVALGQELSAHPPALLDAYVAAVVAEIDAGTLAELPRVWAPTLARALPGVVNLLSDALAGSADALGALEPAQREQVLAGWVQDVDPQRLGEAINRLAALALRVEAEHPTLLTGDTGPDWAALLGAMDHGKLRKALVALSGLFCRVAEPFLAQWATDPVASANLLLTVPPMLNDAMRLLALLVEKMELPDELLASTVFNVVRELDLSALAALTNGLTRTLNVLHRGSAILGGEEPAFKALCMELVDGLLETVDQEGLGDAVVALAEDGEVVARVLARRLTTDPALLAVTLSTGVRLLNVALATGREVLTEVEQLPEAALEELSTRLPEVNPRSVGTLVDQGLRVLSSWERIGGAEGWLEEALAPVDWEATGPLLWRVASPAVGAFVASGWRHHRERPEALGRWINGVLVELNDAVAHRPEAVGVFVPRLLSAVDPGELSSALRSVGRLVGGAVVASAGQPLLQILRTGWRRRRPAAPDERRGEV